MVQQVVEAQKALDDYASRLRSSASPTHSLTSGAGATGSRPRRWSWTSMTRSTLCTAISSWRNGTPIMMSAASCRSMSTMRLRVLRLL